MGKLLDGILNAVSGPVAPSPGPLAPAVTPRPVIDLSTGERWRTDGALKAYYSNAFRACLLAKARPLGALPVDVYSRLGGVREKSGSRVGRRLSRLLRTRWNPVLTGAEGVRWAVMTKDALGNAFVRVQWADGMPVALWPMSGTPGVSLPASGPVFDYPGDKFTPAGRYLSHEVLWLKGPVLDSDGLMGVSLAELAAKELGLSIELEEFYRQLINNGNHFPKWIETDAALKKADVDRLRQQLSDHRGLVAAGETRIFDNGMHVKQAGLTIADMSLVEQETWILQQTCRTLSVPPQEVFELSHATYSNIEQGALNFANKTLVPECKALEQALSGVLWEAGRPDEYVQFDMNGLLRGDYAGRMQGYQTAIYAGMYSPNMALAKEDEAPYEGGDVRFRSAAYIPVDPETGEELEGARGGAGAASPGGSGEGVAYDPGAPNGRPPEDAFAPVYEEMERRVRERFSERGDTQPARDFATRVLRPWAAACLMARIDYDIAADVDRLAREAADA